MTEQPFAEEDVHQLAEVILRDRAERSDLGWLVLRSTGAREDSTNAARAALTAGYRPARDVVPAQAARDLADLPDVGHVARDAAWLCVTVEGRQRQVVADWVSDDEVRTMVAEGLAVLAARAQERNLAGEGS